MSGTSLVQIADDLYAESLADFTPARDARVKELKGTDLAPLVKALRKPSVAAWVVNLLVRRDPGQVDQLLAVGESLRAAQASMSADQLRVLTKQRRQVTAAVTAQARNLAVEEGSRITDAVFEQVETTLTAAMLDADCARAVRSGLLVKPLQSTGIEPADLSEAVACPDALGFTASARAATPPSPPDLQLVPDPEADAKALAAAEGKLAEAQGEVKHAQAERDGLSGQIEELEARSLQIQGEIEEVKRRLADLEESLDELDEEIVEAEEVRTACDSEIGELVRLRDEAEQVVNRLS